MEALPKPDPAADLEAIAKRCVAEHRARQLVVPGIGYPIHRRVDPRSSRLFEIAAENGYTGQYVELLSLVAKEAALFHGKHMPINATGAIGAICCELGLPWRTARGIGVIGRAAGLLGHVMEEMRSPMAGSIWERADREVTGDAIGRARRQLDGGTDRICGE